MGWFNRITIKIIRARIEVVSRTIPLSEGLNDQLDVVFLQGKLDVLKEKLARRTQRELVAICRRIGCDMQSIGGCNAGCHDDCACSVPVLKCLRCGDCDYGENDEADQIRRQCADEYPLINGRVVRVNGRVIRASARAFG